MAKEVVWSPEILIDIEEVLSYWNFHNNSYIYSNKLLDEIILSAEIIEKIPTIGNTTNFQNVRGKVVATHFFIFYEELNNQIILLRFWDGRRNPDSISFM